MKKHSFLFLVLSLLAAAMPAAAGPGFPPGWGGGSAWSKEYDFGTAPAEGANGQAAYIRAKPDAAHNGFFRFTQCIDARDYVGDRLRLSGRLKTVGASAGQLWMQAQHGRILESFDNMYNRRITGTTGWQSRDIVLNVPPGSTRICFGFLLAGGEGEVWADDLSLAPVGISTRLTSSLGVRW